MSTIDESTFCAMSDALSVPDCDPFVDGEGSAGVVDDPASDDDPVEAEPAVAADTALWSPESGVVDAEELVRALLRSGTAAGVMFLPATRLVGSVAYFPEKYGEQILAVALDILHRRPVPPAVFVKHQLVTPETVNHSASPWATSARRSAGCPRR